ncbi:MAG: sodium:calcium antiporter [Bacteroidota bacterium]
MGILIPLVLITICCLVIWRAGDGFMTASAYVGRHLSEGVRGATINAIASSMPEVFTSFFFLFILQDASGFSGGIGTTAGSAIFNSMVIPAVSILAVVMMGMTNKIEVNQRVVRRDGIALIIAEFIFLVLIGGSKLDWYHGFVLMAIYLVYIGYMFWQMNRNQTASKEEQQASGERKAEEIQEEITADLESNKIKAFFTLDLESLFIGGSKINSVNAWSLLITSTVAIATVCYFLVLACEWIGADTYHIAYLGTFNGLGIPVLFVALILAAAASSFPDTIISMKDARKGEYDDAISNALGSNIFDVCFALGFPLFIFTLIQGPIYMPPDIVNMSTELRFLLWLLTIVAFVIFISSRYMGRGKAFLLLGIYVAFIIYVVGRGTGSEWAQNFGDTLVSIVRYFRIG